jgi:NADH:ubiquinone oxidoreductase subunit 6 (subunit J)
MLKFSINAQCLRVIRVVVQVGAVKIYVAAVEALRKKEWADETQFTTKIGGKTSLGRSYFVLQNFIPSYAFDVLLCQNWPFSPRSHTERTGRIFVVYV